MHQIVKQSTWMKGTFHLSALDDLLPLILHCSNGGDSLQLHTVFCGIGLESQTLFGNHLVQSFVQFGNMEKAQQVFNKLLFRNQTSYDSLIIGYVKSRTYRSSLELYSKIEDDDSIVPNSRAFVALLKACAKLKDLEQGFRIHARTAAIGLLQMDVFVGTTLIDMYSKCGCLDLAKKVFDELDARNVVSWTALIAGYVEHDQGNKALSCFNEMQANGVIPNSVTYLCTLKACAILGDIDKGGDVHHEIQKQGLLDTNVSLANTLIDMYAKCGSLAKSQNVFDQLLVQDVASWTVLISGYIEHRQCPKAISLYEQMKLECIFPNAITYSCVLKACSIVGCCRKGCEVHVEIEGGMLLDKDVIVGNSLIDMYAKCGSLIKAKENFDRLPIQNIVSWTTLIAGYSEEGNDEKALELFEEMQTNGFSPNAVTFVCILKSCCNLGDKEKGQELHSEIERQGLVEKDVNVGNSLIDMYCNYGLPSIGKDVFNKIVFRNVITWNSIITGYVENEEVRMALRLFERIREEAAIPDCITFASTIKACGLEVLVNKGKILHAIAEIEGLVASDVVLGSSLIYMYTKFGSVLIAQKVFDGIAVKNKVLWTALIAAYADHGFGKEGLKCYENMQLEGFSPNTLTVISSLKCCGIVGDVRDALGIHVEIERNCLIQKDPAVGSTLIDIYAQFVLLPRAQEVFDKLPIQDIVSWSTLIAGYVDNDHGDEALRCFDQMQLEHIIPNAITYVSTLKACGTVGAIVKGQEIHTELERHGLLVKEINVGNTLIDMYIKCGVIQAAQEVFDKLPSHDAVSWTILMAGYAQAGHSEITIHIFEKMVAEGVKPNDVTFLVLLNACSRRGFVDLSQTYFGTMMKDYGIVPNLKHQNSMVDLFGRAGDLETALSMLQNGSFGPNIVVWRAMLAACRSGGNLDLAKQAFEYAIHFGDDDQEDTTSDAEMSLVSS